MLNFSKLKLLHDVLYMHVAHCVGPQVLNARKPSSTAHVTPVKMAALVWLSAAQSTRVLAFLSSRASFASTDQVSKLYMIELYVRSTFFHDVILNVTSLSRQLTVRSASGRRGASAVRRAKVEVKCDVGFAIRHLRSMEGATVSALRQKSEPATRTSVRVSATELQVNHSTEYLKNSLVFSQLVVSCWIRTEAQCAALAMTSLI